MIHVYYLLNRLAIGLNNCDFNHAETCKDKADTVLPEVNADSQSLTNIFTVVFAVFAFIAVVVIVISGIRYIISQGNPEQHKQAWQTIMYAAIGLVVCLSAELIVNLVLKRL